MKQQLISRLENRTAVVGIIGLGYVGLPLMLGFIEAGYKVLGFDTDKNKIIKLAAGKSYIKHIPTEQIAIAVKTGMFDGTDDFSRAGEADALIICVPTPLNGHREPDLSFVITSVETILPHIRPGQVISLESTTYPGTTDEELLPRLESSGLKVGKDIFLLFSPEREDPGNERYSTRTIPKVCGGVTSACLEVGKVLYGAVIDRVIPVSCTKTAEMTKLLENIHRAVNIGLVNELKMVCDTMGIDIREVIDAAATKPFGFTPYYPGPGLGGHCIPIDPFYLTWKAREYGLNTRFIELAGEVNTAMPEWVAGKIVNALNDRGQALKGARILVLGIAYKKNVDDMRESPSVVLMEKLLSRGAVVHYSDPHVPVFPKIRRCYFDLTSVELTVENLKSYDCVLIATNHDAFDYDAIHTHASLIVDTRGVYQFKSAKVIRA
ncbi:nucleotide sugar dehydrogenase [Geobacter sp. AOG1]|uniref:nucleotide sugar dehydrogenase n=1 Tax=Geobacter sp. AOG1 TaxID=1566346 RepID=UPI001CC4FCDE|nr:nucleotide sugar dehydrogenase [Geobacter sp. AOG1]GFE58366.1 UDP-N-acetyl-D-glucosamine 6-dehydrogenase [Geobacter sp. AOG1]